MIHVWVGTDRWQKAAGAEDVLEYSIKKHSTQPVEIHWMRSGDPGWEVGETGSETRWNCGHDGSQAWPKRGWGTPFSCFRMAVPEAAGFEGVHIYLDADMVLLADIAELAAHPRRNAWLSNSSTFTDVSVIDAAAFKDKKWWPSLAQMRMSGAPMHYYRGLIAQHQMFDESLPWTWNMRDQLLPGGKLLHYTTVPCQPWRPYPSVKYQAHPRPEVAKVFFDYQQEMRERATATAG